MSPPLSHWNSVSTSDAQLVMDQRKQKRLLSNRESARRSRRRKQQYLDHLTSEAAQLQSERNWMLKQLGVLNQRRLRLDAENAGLRNQVIQLTAKLKSLNSVLRIAEESCGTAMDSPDPLLKPWQLHHVVASFLCLSQCM